MVLPALLIAGGTAIGAYLFNKKLNTKIEIEKQKTEQAKQTTEQFKTLPKDVRDERVVGITPSWLDDFSLILKRATPILLIVGGILVVYLLATKNK